MANGMKKESFVACLRWCDLTVYCCACFREMKRLINFLTETIECHPRWFLVIVHRLPVFLFYALTMELDSIFVFSVRLTFVRCVVIFWKCLTLSRPRIKHKTVSGMCTVYAYTVCVYCILMLQLYYSFNALHMLIKIYIWTSFNTKWNVKTWEEQKNEWREHGKERGREGNGKRDQEGEEEREIL